MSVTETEIAPSRALQRYYPWIVIGIAFLNLARRQSSKKSVLAFHIRLRAGF